MVSTLVPTFKTYQFSHTGFITKKLNPCKNNTFKYKLLCKISSLSYINAELNRRG